MPVISARLRKVEESIRQQFELHQMQLQREQIQLKGVQDELQRHSLLHAQQLDREREVYIYIYIIQYCGTLYVFFVQYEFIK